MRLLELLQRCQGRAGIAHKIALEDLRAYLNRTPPDTIIDEMQQISNVPLLKYMMEAGLRWPIYTAFLEHLRKVGREI